MPVNFRGHTYARRQHRRAVLSDDIWDKAVVQIDKTNVESSGSDKSLKDTGYVLRSAKASRRKQNQRTYYAEDSDSFLGSISSKKKPSARAKQKSKSEKVNNAKENVGQEEKGLDFSEFGSLIVVSDRSVNQSGVLTRSMVINVSEAPDPVTRSLKKRDTRHSTVTSTPSRPDKQLVPSSEHDLSAIDLDAESEVFSTVTPATTPASALLTADTSLPSGRLRPDVILPDTTPLNVNKRRGKKSRQASHVDSIQQTSNAVQGHQMSLADCQSFDLFESTADLPPAQCLRSASKVKERRSRDESQLSEVMSKLSISQASANESSYFPESSADSVTSEDNDDSTDVSSPEVSDRASLSGIQEVTDRAGLSGIREETEDDARVSTSAQSLSDHRTEESELTSASCASTYDVASTVQSDVTVDHCDTRSGDETEASREQCENSELPVTSENSELPVTSENSELPVTSENSELRVTSKNSELRVTSEISELRVTSENPELRVTSENHEQCVTSENLEQCVTSDSSSSYHTAGDTSSASSGSRREPYLSASSQALSQRTPPCSQGLREALLRGLIITPASQKELQNHLEFALSPRVRLSQKDIVLDNRGKVLYECEQDAPVPFHQCITESMLRQCVKIGEGVYGEVFRTHNEHGPVALKVIPIEGSQPVNGEPQGKFGDILSEIVITRQLSMLREAEVNVTGSFVNLLDVSVVQGSYPRPLLTAWDKYHAAKQSENDRPDMFDDGQLFLVFVFEDSGCDLEAVELSSLVAGLAVFRQVALALAVAEEALQFEHRDLHWGNILVKRTEARSLRYTLSGTVYDTPACGVKVSIIDFTLAHITSGKSGYWLDLSEDPTLFTGTGEEGGVL